MWSVENKSVETEAKARERERERERETACNVHKAFRTCMSQGPSCSNRRTCFDDVYKQGSKGSIAKIVCRATRARKQIDMSAATAMDQLKGDLAATANFLQSMTALPNYDSVREVQAKALCQRVQNLASVDGGCRWSLSPACCMDCRKSMDC